MAPPKYDLDFAPETLDHLDAIERKYHRFIEQAIDEQLSYTPDRKTRNRKPLEQPALRGCLQRRQRQSDSGPRSAR